MNDTYETNTLNQDNLELESLLSEYCPDTEDDTAFDLGELDALLEDAHGIQPEQKAQADAPEIDTADVGEEKPKKGKKPSGRISVPKLDKRKGLLVGLTVLAILFCTLAGFALSAVLDPHDNRILPGTTLGGIDVGGMTRSEARKAVKEATKNTFSQEVMVVTLPDGEITLTPTVTGVKLNVRSAVKAAFRLGRKDTTGTTELSLLPHLKLNEAPIRAQLEDYAHRHNVAHKELSYRLEGERPPLEEDKFSQTNPVQKLMLTLGTPLQELDVDAALATILEAYGNNQFQVQIESPAYQTQPKEPDWEAIAAEFYIDPVNTSLDIAAYRSVPGSYGYTLDVETGKKLVAQAQYGDTVAIPMTYVVPDILEDTVYFRDELGYCETKHTTNEDRNTNLRLACAAIDGVILQPGEEFSYNGTVGQRTKEKGYKPAAAYSGTRTVNSVGGGVCQVSSTLYYATLLADLEIVQRVNHGFISSYIGAGLDATVSWPEPDFKFRNNYHFPMQIQAEVSDGFVKIRLLGIDEKDYYVKMTSGYIGEGEFYTSWSYKHKYDKETDELISKEREAFSRYFQ